MEDILEVIKSRRSVKKYKKDMVADELIEKVLTAGIYAPTGKNMQSPIILAVTNRELRNRLSRLCAKVRGLDESFDPFYGAPVVLVVLAKKDVFTHVYDGCCVMENMLLEAHSLGLGACWIHHCKEMFETVEGREVLNQVGVDGEYEGIGNCVLGYSDMPVLNELTRKNNYVYYIK